MKKKRKTVRRKDGEKAQEVKGATMAEIGIKRSLVHPHDSIHTWK